jgi:hypothetical protein
LAWRFTPVRFLCELAKSRNDSVTPASNLQRLANGVEIANSVCYNLVIPIFIPLNGSGAFACFALDNLAFKA